MTAKGELAHAEQDERESASRAAPGRKAEAGKASGRLADRAAAFTGKPRHARKGSRGGRCGGRGSEKFGKLRADMDRSGKADGPFNRLKVMRATAAIKAALPPLPMNGPYKAVVIDYPWPENGEATQESIDTRGRALRPYPEMAIKEGCVFMREKVAPLLAEDCTVWFWVTNFHLVRGYHT